MWRINLVVRHSPHFVISDAFRLVATAGLSATNSCLVICPSFPHTVFYSVSEHFKMSDRQRQPVTPIRRSNSGRPGSAGKEPCILVTHMLAPWHSHLAHSSNMLPDMQMPRRPWCCCRLIPGECLHEPVACLPCAHAPHCA